MCILRSLDCVGSFSLLAGPIGVLHDCQLSRLLPCNCSSSKHVLAIHNFWRIFRRLATQLLRGSWLKVVFLWTGRHGGRDELEQLIANHSGFVFSLGFKIRRDEEFLPELQLGMRFFRHYRSSGESSSGGLSLCGVALLPWTVARLFNVIITVVIGLQDIDLTQESHQWTNQILVEVEIIMSHIGRR